MTINLAVIFDSETNGGGGFYQSLSTAKIVNNFKNPNLKIDFFCTSENAQKVLFKYNIKSKILRIGYFERFINTIDQNIFFSKILKKLKYRNSIHKISEKNKIDLFFFLGPSSLIDLVKNSEYHNFIVNIWDINHKLDNYFPEFKSIETFNQKEKVLKKVVNNSFKVIVNSKKASEDIERFYNCDQKKISIIPFNTPLPDISKNNNKEFFNQIFNSFEINKKKIFFYPAQYWPHKNHIYLFSVLKNLKKINNDFILVLTGGNKGNLEFLKKKVTEYNLENCVKFYNFLNEDQIIALYMNSDALLMPTYVARSTLPLLEAFYFNLPVFYSKAILDDEYAKFVNEFNLNDEDDLFLQLKEFLDGEPKYKSKTSAGRNFYDDLSKKGHLELKKIFDEYKFLSSKWK